jgi:hypothetical protein
MWVHLVELSLCHSNSHASMCDVWRLPADPVSVLLRCAAISVPFATILHAIFWFGDYGRQANSLPPHL